LDGGLTLHAFGPAGHTGGDASRSSLRSPVRAQGDPAV
jgi:hypothetical protein